MSISNNTTRINELIEKINALPVNAPDPVFQSKTVTPSADFQIIEPDSGYDGLSEVIIMGDSDLKAENIAEGVNIFGIFGTFAGGSSLPTGVSALASGTITPSSDTTNLSITHDLGSNPSFIIIVPTESNFDFTNNEYYTYAVTMIFKNYSFGTDALTYGCVSRSFYTNIAATSIFVEDISANSSATSSTVNVQLSSSKFRGSRQYRWIACSCDGFE